MAYGRLALRKQKEKKGKVTTAQTNKHIIYKGHSPSPGGGGLVEDEEGGVVVAVQELDVLDAAHPLTQVSQSDGVAGLYVVVLTVCRHACMHVHVYIYVYIHCTCTCFNER